MKLPSVSPELGRLSADRLCAPRSNSAVSEVDHSPQSVALDVGGARTQPETLRIRTWFHYLT